MPVNREQRLVIFEGQVQGVGFRYTACRLASRYDVAGYVRNLPNGAVECVIEGLADQIDMLIADIRSDFDPYIHEVRQQKAPPTGKFRSFTVRY
jgi:acylphosphatase